MQASLKEDTGGDKFVIRTYPRIKKECMCNVFRTAEKLEQVQPEEYQLKILSLRREQESKHAM